MQLTVFTPAYNRAYTLTRLFDSIKMQTASVSFEWIVVDDGSTDETSDLVASWIDDPEVGFEIRYFSQENGGKHVAWNKGLSEARGDLFLPIDSDDYFVADAFDQVLWMWSECDANAKLIGFSGVRRFPGNKDTGGVLNNLGDGYIDYSSVSRRSQGISGDLAEVFFTSELRKYPFPVISHEKFVAEAVIFNRFSNDGYLIRGFNRPLYCSEYLEDGYTKNVDRLLIRNWDGYCLYVKELVHMNASFRAKIILVLGWFYRSLLKALGIVK